MDMKQRVLLFVWLYLGMLAWAAPKASNVYKVCSPDKQLELCIQQLENGKFVYQFSANKTLLIDDSALGFILESGEEIPASGWQVKKISDRKVKSEWKPVWGKRAIVPDCFNEMVLEFSNPNRELSKLQFIMRSYNDGVAFRYKVPEGGNDSVKVRSEQTAYHFADDYIAWFYNGEKHNIGPERLTASDGIRRPIMTVKAGE